MNKKERELRERYTVTVGTGLKPYGISLNGRFIDSYATKMEADRAIASRVADAMKATNPWVRLKVP